MKVIKSLNGPQKVDEYFSLEAIRDDDDEIIMMEFHVVRPMHSAAITSVLGAVRRNPQDAIALMAPVVRRVLDDKDGVSAKAEPEDGKAPEPYEKGSSRRRWNELMDPESEEYGVPFEHLVAILEFLVELSAGNPTTPSA